MDITAPANFNANLFATWTTPTDRERLSDPAEVLRYFGIKPGSTTPQEAGDAVFAATGCADAAEAVAHAIDVVR